MIEKFKNILIPFLVILIFGVILQKGHFNEYPNGIHAWSQAQQHAISIGFVNNDLNFFSPEGFTFNKQFPDNWQKDTKSTITSVDFPIHNYIPAVLMYISGSNSPVFHRSYIFILSFIGLFFLFKIAMLITGNLYRSIFIVIFGASSPVFIYYQSNFLPSIPSLSCAIIGIYYYLKYLKFSNHQHFILALTLCTAAALSRSSLVICLITIIISQLSSKTRLGDRLNKKIFPLLISLFAVAVYYFYNQILLDIHGSMFLSSLKPPTNWDDFVDIIFTIKDNWLFEYFSVYHYCIVVILICSYVFVKFTRKDVAEESKSNLKHIIIIYFSCTIVYALLIMRMFKQHDYHFLDTFYLPSLLLVIHLISKIPAITIKAQTIVYSVLLVGFSALVLGNGLETQQARRTTQPYDRTAKLIHNFQGAEEFIDSLKIPTTAKMLVIDGPYPSAPTLPFIHMNRKGYTAMTYKSILDNSLKWDFDYIVIQNDLIHDDLKSQYPEFLQKIDFIASNDRITICSLKNKHEVWKVKMDYDDYNLRSWKNINSTGRISYSGRNSGEVSPENEYGLTYTTKDQPLLKTQSRTIRVSSKVLTSNIKNSEIIVYIKENGKKTYYKANGIQNVIQQNNTWESVEFEYQLPQVYADDYEFVVYVWNKAKDKFYIDDFEVKIY